MARTLAEGAQPVTTFDPTRLQFAIKPPLAPARTYSALAAYLQEALNRLDRAGLVVDGLYGPKTTAAVRAYQTTEALAVTGAVDRGTWYRIDWEVYDGWQAAPASMNSSRPGGMAIVNGRNKYSGERVNNRGLTREAQRVADVINHYAPVDFRRNFAVDRTARGSSRLSWHAFGEANDDMTDLDRDRALEPDEIRQCNAMADLMFTRAQGWPLERRTRQVWQGKTGADGTPVMVTITDEFRGPDRWRTGVWGNHKLEGVWHFPVPPVGGRKDWSWSARRNTWKPLTASVHDNHLHLDVVPGGPIRP